MIFKNIFSAKFLFPLFLIIIITFIILSVSDYGGNFSSADSIVLKAEITAEYQEDYDDLEQLILDNIKSLQLQNWKDQVNRVEKNQKDIRADLVKVIIILERLDK